MPSVLAVSYGFPVNETNSFGHKTWWLHSAIATCVQSQQPVLSSIYQLLDTLRIVGLLTVVILLIVGLLFFIATTSKFLRTQNVLRTGHEYAWFCVIIQPLGVKNRGFQPALLQHPWRRLHLRPVHAGKCLVCPVCLVSCPWRPQPAGWFSL